MTVTRKDVVDEARSLLGEPESDFFTDDEVTRWTNQAQDQFCRFTEAMRSRWSRHLATYQGEVPRPNDCIRIETVWYRNSSGEDYYQLEHKPWDRWTEIPNEDTSVGSPDFYAVRRDNMVVLDGWPAARCSNALIIEGVQTALALTNDDCAVFRPKNADDESSPFAALHWESLAWFVAFKGAVKDKDFKAAAVFKQQWGEALVSAKAELSNSVRARRRQRPFGGYSARPWPRNPANTGGSVPTT